MCATYTQIGKPTKFLRSGDNTYLWLSLLIAGEKVDYWPISGLLEMSLG